MEIYKGVSVGSLAQRLNDSTTAEIVHESHGDTKK